MPGEIMGPSGELNPVTQINGHSAKLTSKYLRLCPKTNAALSLNEGSLPSFLLVKSSEYRDALCTRSRE